MVDIPFVARWRVKSARVTRLVPGMRIWWSTAAHRVNARWKRSLQDPEASISIETYALYVVE